ncbi:hypothetical protein CTAYLR_005057 [Chrysophaeum taylorii]|uniref:Solute-binding protein family 5 domain-containing protein n=1 Tax=Chrysophaeum taylorii TaxID=2483200 RepID=A0AAD7UC36_9STRA|nr:hypothetical protein CTAYLR_005057 [Chrysophaeum taylorii]
MFLSRLVLLAAAARADDSGQCNAVELDFVVLDGEASHRAIEDDIRAALLEVGLTARSRFLEKEEFNTAMVTGDYDLVFSETWGAPYDPHSYVASWTTPDEAHYSVLQTHEPPLDPKTFASWVANVSSEVDPVERQETWTEILSAIHAEVIHLPLWGKRIPSVVGRRLEGYVSGPQQFDYPIASVRVVEGSKNVTVAPGAQTGLFKSVGPLDPHGYRPNEFFSNNWIYEGLVKYGPSGRIEASLAKTWTTEIRDDGGETFRFSLREGVVFHDGSAFNCTVVELNFDHVFAPPLRGPDWHGWYGLPGALANWYCDGDDFVLETTEPYYPLLQELTYIRPMRILSPAAFTHGIYTSPATHNSCPASWGSITGDDGSTVTCVGTLAPSGTGPFRFVSRTVDDDDDDLDREVVFGSNPEYWGGEPDIEFVRVLYFETHARVEEALLSGELDAVIGAGVLEPSDIQDLQYSADFDVLHSEPTQNTVIIMNIDDIDVRKVVVHAVNKGPIIERELGGIEQPVSQLFPESAPYCDVDLVPKFDYDLEKALLLNCPDSQTTKKKNTKSETLYGALFAAAAVLAVVLTIAVCYMVQKERAGEPLFMPLTNPLIEDEVQLAPIKEDSEAKDTGSKTNAVEIQCLDGRDE